MPIPPRKPLCLALTACLGLAALAPQAPAQTGSAAPAEKVFPDSAVFFLKVNDATGLLDAFKQSQYGRLWADPAMKPFRDDIATRLGNSNSSVKARFGMTIPELLRLPQGPIALAVVPAADANNPVGILLTMDAGKNADKVKDVLAKALKQLQDAGAKVSKDEAGGTALTVVQAPKPKDAKDDDDTPPPLAWGSRGTVFFIGTDPAGLKDLVGHAAGRDDSVAASATYAQALKKVGTDAQAVWYSDLAKLLKVVTKAAGQGKNAANVEQGVAMAQMLGLSGLKAAAGSFALNSGPFDSVTRTFLIAPAPLQGVLKLLALPKVALKPEPWVPATVATYQTFSVDLDAVYNVVNDMANMFNPGFLNVLEQQLVGPNGGEPLNFKKDIFDPLGDRITLVTDYKKPITEDSQRMVLAFALEDAKGFEATLGKLIALSGGAPKKRDFQGTTVYDFDLPEMPNAAANGANPNFKGPVSVAVSKNTLFVSTEPSALEQALRGGGPALADDPGFQAVAKQMPAKVSSLSYVRPDESARVSYDLIKSGKFEKAMQGAAVAGGPDVSKVGKVIDKDKLPDFSVFTRYLSSGGGYSLMEDDGLTSTNFTLRKANP